MSSILELSSALKNLSPSNSLGNYRKSSAYIEYISRIKEASNTPPDFNNISVSFNSIEDHPDYQLILLSNDILLNINEEINSIFELIHDIYDKKFPELLGILNNNKELYIKLILKLKNAIEISSEDLTGLISSHQIMLIKISLSTTSGRPLAPQLLAQCLSHCETINNYTLEKEAILSFISSRINYIAPNVATILGVQLTSLLISLTGGIKKLSQIPSCNLEVVGRVNGSNNDGVPTLTSNDTSSSYSGSLSYSTLTKFRHFGILYHSDLVQQAPPDVKKKIFKIICAKVSIASRIDAVISQSISSTNNAGINNVKGYELREEIEKKLEKLLEPHKKKMDVALPIPEEQKKSKRGGKRIRKLKEKFIETEVRKAQNQLKFSLDGAEYGDSAMGLDQGLLSQSESGRIRGPKIVESKFLTNKKRVASQSSDFATPMNKKVNASSGSTHGVSSSLVFTPIQGLELVNPAAAAAAAAQRVKEANNKWFNTSSGFASALPK